MSFFACSLKALGYDIIRSRKCQGNFHRYFTQKTAGFFTRRLVLFPLQGIFDETVATIVSAVDHSERAMVVLIPEGKEVVLQQVHL